MTTLPARNNAPSIPTLLLAVDSKRLAELLCVSVRHVERLDSAGKIPAGIYLGKAKRWLLDGPNGIRAWLAAGCPDRVRFKAMQGLRGGP